LPLVHGFIGLDVTCFEANYNRNAQYVTYGHSAKVGQGLPLVHSFIHSHYRTSFDVYKVEFGCVCMQEIWYAVTVIFQCWVTDAFVRICLNTWENTFKTHFMKVLLLYTCCVLKERIECDKSQLMFILF
jgi:hypothetical protein